ncbi:hypothetical protein JC200_17880 [Alicyclobacillus sp. ALC3]|nr:hypothetical protein JC200_17880 [Alicyclobacillus sp. ALC3]
MDVSERDDSALVQSKPVVPPSVNPAWQQYEREMMELCAVKADEFHLLGYEEVTASEVWQCVLAMTKGRGRLHEMVEAVLGLNAGRFMSYTTINAYQGIFHEQGTPFDALNHA